MPCTVSIDVICFNNDSLIEVRVAAAPATEQGALLTWDDETETVDEAVLSSTQASVRLDQRSGQLSLLPEVPNELGNMPPPVEEEPTIRRIISDNWIRRMAETHGLETHRKSTKKIVQEMIGRLEAKIAHSMSVIYGGLVRSVAVFWAPDQPPKHEIVNLSPNICPVFRLGPYARGPPTDNANSTIRRPI